MRDVRLLILGFFALFIVNGCGEEDLELSNPSGLSPENFFKNEAQVQASVNAIYANMQTIGLYTRLYFYEMDNMSHENEGNPQLEADKRVFLNFSFDSSHPPISWYWDSCFRGINKANFVINNEDRITNIPSSLLSEERKAKFIGEAKFLRGFYYFLLVTRFGDVPLITDIPESGDGVPRSPASEVYDQIVEDLQDASQTLLSRQNEENGRATKGAAFALLGKTQLYRKNYEAAMQAFNEIYGDYSLEANYFDNFKEETEFGPESIFEVQFDDDLGDGSKWNSNVSGEGPNEVTFRGQEYGFNDWFNAYPSDNLINEYENGDPRLDANFYTVGDEWAGGIIESLPLDRQYAWRKYQNYYKDVNEDQASGINMKVIRYADVLLMMAEATNELGNSSEAIGYINEVRERVDMPLLGNSLSQSQVFDAIVHERMVELAGEQVRFPDLVRWGLAADYLSQYGFQSGKNELFPIPNDEIVANDSISSANQNPGF